MRAEVAAFCRRWDLLPQGSVVLCAVSGGRDSVALLHLLRSLSGEMGFALEAAHFNHCLRPTADRDETFVRDLCRSWGVPLTVGRGDVSAFARREGLSVEDAARQLRYRFLEETAHTVGAGRIAAAHHRQDNAETVLLHLLRGAGLRGLTGMAPIRGILVRPLLETDRADIDAYIQENGLPFVEDETNQDTSYTRNRLRLEVMPLLEEMAPGCTRRIAETAGLLRADSRHLEGEAAAALPAGDALPLAALEGRDEAIRRRMVRALARQAGVELTARQTEAALSLGSGGHLDLPGGWSLCRREGALRLHPAAQLPPPMILRPGRQTWGPYTVLVERTDGGTPSGPGTVLLDAGRASGALSIGPWDGTGRLGVENGSRTIKRLFADRGIPVEERESHPALYLEGRPIAVFGVAADWDCRPRPGAVRLTVTLARKEHGDDLLL